MSKKLRGAGRGHWLVNPRKIERWVDLASIQVCDSDFEGAIATCQKVIRNTSRVSLARADALKYLGIAEGMLQNFDAAYAAYSEALEIAPHEPEIWYNRGVTCRFVLRIGQSVRDLERAVKLEGNGDMAERFSLECQLSRDLAERSMALRGPGFTLEQLIEQEDLFHRAITLMNREEWSEAEQSFRLVITMGDCLPQPWGNLGVCLLMQGRKEEGEVALRRALEVDPGYEPALKNLKVLASLGAGDRPISVEIPSPFAGRNPKLSLSFRAASD